MLLAILLDDGTVIRDNGWHCVADVMVTYHGFGVNRVYGTLVDAHTLEPYNFEDPHTTH